ncbi:MAG: hypothetical protein MK165_11120 [Pirellulaceae bacterium]|nr:hypothetical protein [Pirellulaceae bacterium]
MKLRLRAFSFWGLIFFSDLLFLLPPPAEAQSESLSLRQAKSPPGKASQIDQFDQHFNLPGGDLAPWSFVPSNNIQECSTETHPGLVTIYEAGKGQDVKGILAEPIGIEDFRLPWEFQTSLVQSFNATAGVGVATQVNTAIGLNVALTFSEPEEWPEDRLQRPPKTRDFQLLVVHLGSTGEAGIGLPQYSKEPHPETYLVWGRGDLGYTVMGDWEIPYVWIGDGAKYGGPASPQLFFRCVVQSPTQISVGIKFDASHGWNMRHIDCSAFGKITGIWELGPIISADRWIPDELCRQIPQKKGPHPLFVGKPPSEANRLATIHAPNPEPPDPNYEYYVDYCVFFDAPPRPFEALSDDFDILGYLAKWQVQEQCTLMDTHSHPGHLMLKLLGPGLGTGFGVAGGSQLDLKNYPPPWEIEVCFEAPDDDIPWNFFMNFIVVDDQGKQRGLWLPGVQNNPQAGKYTLFRESLFKLEFEHELSATVFGHKPLRMLIQCIDERHVRLGFRSDPKAPWSLSRICDVGEILGTGIGMFGMHNWSTVTGRMYGAPPGGPMYQTFLIDYIHYRYGLSVK